ncbi:MAG: M48 family metalloprotease [Phycisphaerales bacterium]
MSVGLLFGLIAFGTSESPANQRPLIGLAAGGLAAGVSLLVIMGGSIYRIKDLSDGGGSSVAQALGGMFIDSATRDPDERRVLNVVEEMAIASGVPVPPVYIMPNEGRINAFAAGYSPGDAVIGVTKGCVHGLTREELQGVMA